MNPLIKEPTDEPPGDDFFIFMANDLRQHWAQQTKEEQEYEELFGPIDENLLAEYQDGKCTADERKQVEEAMEHFPALREALELMQQMDAQTYGSAQRRQAGAAMSIKAACATMARIATLPGWLAIKGLERAKERVFRDLYPRPDGSKSTEHKFKARLSPRWPTEQGHGYNATRPFTLIEGVVSVALVATAFVCVVPYISAAREAARRAQCTNNLHAIGLALANYEDQSNCYPPGGISFPGEANPRNPEASGLAWRALILSQMENNAAYNAINLQINFNNGVQFTAFNTAFRSWLCPSDGTNGNGRLPSNTPDGQWTHRPIDPSTGQPSALTSVANYAGSFGDNYAGGVLCSPGLSWETPWNGSPPPGQARIGWNGYWGTWFGPPDGFTGGVGMSRGFFDAFGTQRPPKIATITDGTSNTIMVGEVIPSRAADSNFWYLNGGCAGTTVPLGWNSNTHPAASPDCLGQWYNSTAPNGCRFSAAAKGFVSMHPGGANFLFGDGSVRFLKNGISPVTYCALGSRAGGEVVPSDDY